MLVVGMGGGGGQRYFVPLCCQVLEMKKQEKASIALWFGLWSNYSCLPSIEFYVTMYLSFLFHHRPPFE